MTALPFVGQIVAFLAAIGGVLFGLWRVYARGRSDQARDEALGNLEAREHARDVRDGVDDRVRRGGAAAARDGLRQWATGGGDGVPAVPVDPPRTDGRGRDER